VAKNVVIVGAAHLTGGVPKSKKNVKGYVRGFDVRTGKRSGFSTRFLVPTNMESKRGRKIPVLYR